MLASTMQFSRNGRSHAPGPPRGRIRGSFGEEMVREIQRNRLDPSGPNNVPGTRPPRFSRFHSGPRPRSTDEVFVRRVPNSRRSTSEHLASRRSLDLRVSGCRRNRHRYMLLRKEVIQPHLPVRLPCYDLVPIASPTFDGSLPKGLGHRLRVLPTFVT